MREYGLMAYRTELTRAARANGTVVCAGQIDALFIDKHGFCYMVDWKRTSKSLDPDASSFGGFGRTEAGPLRHVPANAYSQICTAAVAVQPDALAVIHRRCTLENRSD